MAAGDPGKRGEVGTIVTGASAADAGMRLERPATRVIALGASNLIRSLNWAWSTCRECFPGPLDMLCAGGHGRSYGVVSSFLFVRYLPGILSSGIWPALGERPPAAATYGLISDIGNDLLHGYSAEEIAGWVEQCVLRLREHSERISIAQLPMDGLRRLGKARFLFLRRLTYPRSRLSYHDARRSLEDLDARITQLSETYALHSYRPLPEWFGFDPIHVRSRCYREAWQSIAMNWFAAREAEQLRAFKTRRESWRQWLRVQRLRPQTRTLFGRRQEAQQPALVCSDGSQLSLF